MCWLNGFEYGIILTFNIDRDAFADRGWNTVRCNAQVRSHFSPADTGQVQLLTSVDVHCTNRDTAISKNPSWVIPDMVKDGQ